MTDVSFSLTEESQESLGSFTYYVKVAAEGGQTHWSEAKVFETQCGNSSAGIVPSAIPSPMIAFIAGS